MIRIPYYETSNFVFSNFSAHAVTYKGVTYPTVEHAYHAQKFEDQNLRHMIMEAASPLVAWQIAQDLKSKRRADWNSVKVGILKEIIQAKIEQHDEVRQALLSTGDEEIAEINPNDSFWGSGQDGKGQNQAGKILMQLRKDLASLVKE